jgi:hypothetical protein
MNSQQPQQAPKDRSPALPPPPPKMKGDKRMKFETILTTPDLIFGTIEGKEKTIREGFTSMNVCSIVGLDKQDGGAILISRESWKRLEVFMALLSGIEMSISEEKLKAVLDGKQNK